MRVLVVDDDPAFRSYVQLVLGDAVTCVEAIDTEDARKHLEQEDAPPCDAILLDVRLPRETGWEFVADLRKRGVRLPVILISALDSAEERIRGLHLGADDYLTKGVAPEELLERLQAVVRRYAAMGSIVFADIRMDRRKRAVWIRDEPTKLSSREFDVLSVLLQRPGKVVTRAELLREVWNITIPPGTNVVDVHMARLRRRIARSEGATIEAVRQQGYRLVRRRGAEEKEKKEEATS